MPRTRIIDRGFEAVINIMPSIGGEEISRISEQICNDLCVGREVSLADVQERFGIQKTRYSERYLLKEDYYLDWVWLHDPSISGALPDVVGVSITISGFYKERKKSELETGYRKKKIPTKSSQLNSETERNGACVQLRIPL